MGDYAKVEMKTIPPQGLTPEEASPLHVAADPDSWADKEEVERFELFLRRFFQGEVDPDEFKRFRLQHGVYAQRQEGLHMVRVKIPWGGITARQLERLAEVAEETPRGVGHVTTRQNIQFHFVNPEALTSILQRLAEVGLTKREACGNTVRNVTGCPHAGVAPDEPFDVTPYAEETARFLLRNPMNQDLPRKFKISFSGCRDECGLAPIHDIGAVAVLRECEGTCQQGFRLYVGGGLGPSPRAAQPLEEFTSAEELLLSIVAVLRVFDRYGNRENKHLARLKFLIRNLGMDKFRDLVFVERDGLRVICAGSIPRIRVSTESYRPQPFCGEQTGVPNGDPDYRRWWITNVRAQKQPGYFMATARLPLGDVTGLNLRVLAFAARQFADGRVRTTNQQNVLLRWVLGAKLPALYRLLRGVNLADPSAGRLADITACPGADTCQLGITSSRGLAKAMGEMLQNSSEGVADSRIRIRISGCPNSCGHHHVAGIGFCGGAREFKGRQAPTYQVFLGATLDLDATRFAQPALKVPAKNAPALVGRLVELYQAEQLEDEEFEAFVDRVGLARIRRAVASLTDLPPHADAPDAYLDCGKSEPFRVQTGRGECAP